jgi:putative hydrolase of the HAD superfamily
MVNAYLDHLKPFLESIEPISIQPTGAEPVFSKDNDIKAVVFDIYGTLVISASGDIMQASYDASMFSQALKNSGYQIKVQENDLMEIHPLFETEVKQGKEKAQINGTPFPELNIVNVWQKTLHKAETLGLIASTPSSDIQLFTFIFELKSNQVWPMPGLRETITNLKRKGVPLGSVSNAQFYTPVMMNYFLYDTIKGDEFVDGFEKDLSVFSYKILKGKPDKDVFKELLNPLNKRGLAQEEVLFVGNDMLKDIYASSQLGFKTCFFAGDMRAYRLRENHPEASKIKPDHIITELKQLLEIL